MKTDQELGEIGARAAYAAGNRAGWLMAVHDGMPNQHIGHSAWRRDEPARTAFAAAVAAEVRKEGEAKLAETEKRLADATEVLTPFALYGKLFADRDDIFGYVVNHEHQSLTVGAFQVATRLIFPEPSKEEKERAEFEAWWEANALIGGSKASAWQGWQAARASKEGEV